MRVKNQGVLDDDSTYDNILHDEGMLMSLFTLQIVYIDDLLPVCRAHVRKKHLLQRGLIVVIS